jgi:thiosulfate reductase cytochrome b subunit
VRIWHWLNAVCFALLMATGFQIRYRDLVREIAFETAVRVHNVAAIALLASFALWIIYYVGTGRLGVYVPELRAGSIRAIKRQARYYLWGILAREPNPHVPSPDSKFNPLQQLAYLGVMLFMLPAVIASGVLLWDVDRFARWIDAVGGLKLVSTVHVGVSFALLAFLVGHLYLVTLGHTLFAHVRAMVTGYEELESGPGDASGS